MIQIRCKQCGEIYWWVAIFSFGKVDNLMCPVCGSTDYELY